MRCLFMCIVENFKNYFGFYRVRVCYWFVGDVFCSWFYERGFVLDISYVYVVFDYLFLFIVLLFWILKIFFFCEEGVNWVICGLYVEFIGVFKFLGIRYFDMLINLEV